MKTVHVVLPQGIDDPARPSGGNTYDRHVCRQLGLMGWSVHEHAVPGPWPQRDDCSLAGLAGVVGRIPDGAVVLLDGLVASGSPEVLVPEARRLCLIILVHMPLGHRPADEAAQDVRRREGMVLRTAAVVVTTSQWTRRRLLELYQLLPDRVRVAMPGAEAAELATGTSGGGALLCVAAVTFEKGHDLLLDALRSMSALSWRCVCVGSLERAPAFVSHLLRHTSDGPLRDRVSFVGPRTGSELHRAYADADLVVLASRAETYGLVITEALARGLPVMAAAVGGVVEAMGRAAGGIRPGVLVPPEDPAALAAALRAWLGDAELRGHLRRAASERRDSLAGWSSTASILTDVFAGASA